MLKLKGIIIVDYDYVVKSYITNEKIDNKCLMTDSKIVVLIKLNLYGLL